ncbi:MAG: hypothetical protein ACLPUO_18890 [Streptosporangiaceae bacterium]
MNPGSSATRSVHAAVVLSVTGAVIFMAGLMTTLVGEAVRLTSHHAAPVLSATPASVGIGTVIAVIGLALGLTALLLVACLTAAGRFAARRPRSDPDAHPRPDGAARREEARARREEARTRRDEGQEESADDWLRPLRPGHSMAGHPEGGAGQDRRQRPEPVAGYADDGWHPDFLTGPQGRHATGPLPVYTTGPLPAVRPGPGSAPLAPLPPVPADLAAAALAPQAPVTVGGQERDEPGPPDSPRLDQSDSWATSAAAGEAAAGHFEELGRRQRDLMREYFAQSGAGPETPDIAQPGLGQGTEPAAVPGGTHPNGSSLR